ncbi:MAG: hypothetical protein Q8L35_05280 [Actinomycetota bacterium]|nr:hypothetical protein [Actinomycetota bacterium]
MTTERALIAGQPDVLSPLDDIFDLAWWAKRADKELRHALLTNQDYRAEVNKWLLLFESKGWLTSNVIKRLKTASSWSSFYSKINEFRAAYFIELKLGVDLENYESPTQSNKNVDFSGRQPGQDKSKIFIEVKTPLHHLDKAKRLRDGGGFDHGDIICGDLLKALAQAPQDSPFIVILSDDLVPHLELDLNAQDSIWMNFLGPCFNKISAVLMLGNVYKEEMYKMKWSVNQNANNPIDASLFDGFERIFSYEHPH